MKMVKEINYLAFKCLKLQTYYDNNISVGPCYDGHASQCKEKFQFCEFKKVTNFGKITKENFQEEKIILIQIFLERKKKLTKFYITEA